MAAVELQYFGSRVLRPTTSPQQQIVFCVAVQNLGFAKQVSVIYAEPGGDWFSLPARYLGPAGGNRELWTARQVLRAPQTLPGDLRFAVRYQVNGREHWDNHRGRDYRCAADGGLILGEGIALRALLDGARLGEGQDVLPVVVAVRPELRPDEVRVRFTRDQWQSQATVRCEPVSAPHPGGASLWTARLEAAQAWQVGFAVACTTGDVTHWDNNFGLNYEVRHAPLKVLTLNLHCYQEPDADAKLALIAKVIAEQDIDVVCLQEVGEEWNEGRGDFGTNAARRIRDQLPSHYHLHTDWAHLGFERYREGVAILSRYPFVEHQARYLSTDRDVHSIHTRKAVMAQIHVPLVGVVNVFSVHLSWWEDGFSEQLQRLQRWAEARQEAGAAATLLCGDFNVAPGSPGYAAVVEHEAYADTRSLVAAAGARRVPGGQGTAAPAGAVDHVFLKQGSALRPIRARTLFTESDYGRVSDHFGCLVELEPT